MKITEQPLRWVQVLLLTGVTAGLLGCGKSENAAESPGTSPGAAASAPAEPVVDLSKVERLFESASGTIKTQWDQVVAAVKSANYAGALKSLQTLAADAGISADQKAAVNELMAQVKEKANQAWRGAADAANKVINEATDAATEASEKASKAAKELLPK
jgi:hypothetical protein